MEGRELGYADLMTLSLIWDEFATEDRVLRETHNRVCSWLKEKTDSLSRKRGERETGLASTQSEQPRFRRGVSRQGVSRTKRLSPPYRSSRSKPKFNNDSPTSTASVLEL